MTTERNKIFYQKMNFKFTFITLFLLFFPLISSNIITMKFKGTGKEEFFMNQFAGINCPDKIYIDGILLYFKTGKYNFSNKITNIKLKWNKNIINCYKMFANISNIIEIDLSQFNTSLVENMSYMFSNCKSLIYANLSNINISSILNMDNMFQNCFSLESLDLTNVNISKLFNHKNIFFNCNKLDKNSLLYRNKYPKFSLDYKINNEETGIIENNNPKRILEESTNYCTIYQIFNRSIGCTINLSTANEEILEGLQDQKYRHFLINDILDSHNITSIYNQNGNEQFTIALLKYIYEGNTQNAQTLERVFIYEHATYNKNYIIPLCYFIVFNIKNLYSSYNFNDEIILVKSVEINENELYKYYNSSGYYSDNCSYSDGLSLYERKKNYNENNLFICQSNCYYKEYDSSEKTVQCSCHLSNLTGEELVNKFELLEEDNNKCAREIKISDNLKNNKEIYDFIVKNILETYPSKNGADQLVKGKDNIVFQITTTENQINLLKSLSFNKMNISIIDLGHCEDLLKTGYKIDNDSSLIIVKNENVSKTKSSEKNVQYDVFEPYNKTKLNLSLCEGTNINLYVKMELSEENKNINEEMKKHGYDMFNINDKFYKDICTPFKSVNNTDILLSDRIDYIYNNDDTQCQSNCQFSEYSLETQYMVCICSVNKEFSMTKYDKFSGKKLYESFADVLKYSNYDVYKCYNLVFSKSVFTKNIGSYLIITFLLGQVACFILFLIKKDQPLKIHFQILIMILIQLKKI